MMWERVLVIAAGGALGALSRYGLGVLVAERLGSTVLATFAVNISGALALGVFIGLMEGRWSAPGLAHPAVAVGFLGAYTTFSTLMLETVDLGESRSYVSASATLIGSCVAGLVAAYGGLLLGRNV
jgi:CrcB protein